MSQITRQTNQQIFDRLSAQFSAEVLGGGSIIPESNEFYVVANDVAATITFNAVSDQIFKERDPRFACEANLIDMAGLDGVYPRPAVAAEGYVSVKGEVGATVPSLLQFSSGEQKYTSRGDLPAVIPDEGEIIVRISADIPGVDGNEINSTVMSLDTVATGLETDVSIFGTSLCGGSDAETIEQFRARYLSRLSFKPRATLEWILDKAAEWPCVTRVIHRCCENTEQCCEDCTNILDFYVMMDDTFECGIAPECVINEITTWMFGETQGYGMGQVEFGICGKAHPVQPVIIDIEIDGAACLSQSNRAVVENAIVDYFRTVEPSGTLCARSITSQIDRIAVDPCSYDVILTPRTTDNVQVTECNDIDFDCDYIPCLGNITFSSEIPNEGICV